MKFLLTPVLAKQHRLGGIAFLWGLVLCAVAPAFAETAVDGIQAVARHSQMFLTWKETETPPGTTFTMYVSSSPISDVGKATRGGHHIDEPVRK